MLDAPNLKGLIIFLVVAGVIVPLFHRVRIGTVLGFLIAGVLLGPHGLARFVPDHPWVHYVTFDEPQRANALAEFGIVVMLFLLGLELSLQRLWQLRRYVLGVGLAQVLVATLAIGLTERLAGAPRPAGAVLGLCLALSSTAIVMQVLNEQHRVANPTGRIALSVLLFQDMMVVPILFVVGILAGRDHAEMQSGVLGLIGPFAGAFAAVVAIMVAGRFLIRPLLRSAVRTGSRDLIMAVALLILMAFSVATGLAGMSIALGAFLAGLLISDSEARHHVEVDLEPFKGLLLGIFFITVGTRLDVGAVAGDAFWIVAALVLLLAIKAAVLFGAACAFGVPRPVAAEVALLLAQAGEFAFVVIGTARAEDLLSPRLASGAVAVVALSMLVTPLLSVAGRAAARRLENASHGKQAPPADAAALKDHVVIGGFGRVGRLVAEVLEAENVPYIALDADGDMIAHLRAKDRPVYFGDASRPELLTKIGAENARAFVVTVGDRRAAERMVAAARTIQPKAAVFARAADAAHAARLTALGAAGVIPVTVEASLQLAGRVLERLELSEEAISQRIDAMRVIELGRLDQAAAPD